MPGECSPTSSVRLGGQKTRAAQRWARTGHLVIFTTRAALSVSRKRKSIQPLDQHLFSQIPVLEVNSNTPTAAAALGVPKPLSSFSTSPGQSSPSRGVITSSSPKSKGLSASPKHEVSLRINEELTPLLSYGKEGSLSGSLSERIPASRSFFDQCWAILTVSYLNCLLLALPISFWFNYIRNNALGTFVSAFVALVPLANLLGTFTEDLALTSNDYIASLLNATFGNATEMIISIFALRADMYSVIKNSLIGSVLGNMMLVLGTAMVAAGWRHNEFKYNSNAVRVYVSLLLLASFGMILTTTFSATPAATQERTLLVSREASVFMIIGYVLYLCFQLFTHKALFDSEMDLEEGGEPSYSILVSVVMLAVTTVLVSIESEFLVDSLNSTSKASGLNQGFISIILVPIVGNVAEHATAVTMAYRNKMDIAVGVAVGSSIQISLFVVPLMVLISSCMGKSLDLNFEPFSAVTTFVSVIIVMSLVLHGRGHWLAGALLVLAYFMFAGAFLCVGPRGDITSPIPFDSVSPIPVVNTKNH